MSAVWVEIGPFASAVERTAIPVHGSGPSKPVAIVSPALVTRANGTMPLASHSMFTEERKEFRFEWSHLGDIRLGRPNLGPQTSVAAYRLMQFTLRDAAIKHTNAEKTRRIFYDAGHNAGKAVYENLIRKPSDVSDLIGQLQRLMADLRIGILRMEETDFQNLTFRLAVSEDLDCSGLPVMDEAVCTYDEGFIAGILEAHTGVPFHVEEVDCWCTGDRVCRFEAAPLENRGRNASGVAEKEGPGI